MCDPQRAPAGVALQTLHLPHCASDSPQPDPTARLDLVEDRSKQAFKTWLAERPQDWRENAEVIAMDGFTGFKTAAATSA